MGEGETRRLQKARKLDRKRLFPIVTSDALFPDSPYLLFFLDNRTRAPYIHTQTDVQHARITRMQSLTHVTQTHTAKRDASRAAALNYRPDAILMRSIIYGARHRPLNIPRSTKESSRDPGIIPGPVFANSGNSEYAEHRRYSAPRRYFRESPL